MYLVLVFELLVINFLQILPFLALGLGVDDMFLLAHTYASARDKNKVHASCTMSDDYNNALRGSP